MAASLVLTHAEATLSVSLRESTPASDGSFNAVAIVLRQADIEAVLELADPPLKIPAELLNRDEGLRLKTLTEIRSEAELEARRRAEGLRQRLREAFTARRDIRLSGNLEHKGTFFGLTMVGNALLKAKVEISSSLLDQDESTKAEFFIRAEASAVVTIKVNAKDAPGPERQKLVIAVAAAAAGLTAKVNVDVPSLAGFDLQLPEFKLPRLKFDGVDVDFGGLPSFGIGSIPILGDVVARWDTKPSLKLLVADGSLSVTTEPLGEASVFLGEAVEANRILKLTNVELKGAQTLSFSATVDVTQQAIPTASVPDVPAGPFTVRLGPGEVDVQPVVVGGATKPEIKLVVTLEQLVVFCTNDPKLTLPLKLGFEVDLDTASGEIRTRLTQMELRPPYPVDLLRKVGELVGKSIRIVGAIQLPQGPDVPSLGLTQLLERLGAMLAAAAQWLADQAGAAGRVLVGIGESIRDALLALYRKLANLDGPSINPPSTDLVIEVRLDAANWSLRQICIMPGGKDSDLDYKDFATAAGFDFGYQLKARPSLVLDVQEQWLGLCIRTLNSTDELAVLATDLWLSRESAPAEPLNVVDEKSGNRNSTAVQQTEKGAFQRPKRLLGVKVTSKNTEKDLVLVALQRGALKFFQSFDAAAGRSVPLDANGSRAVCIPEDSRLTDAGWDDFFQLDPYVDTDALKEAVLNLLPKADPAKRGGGGGFLDKLGQYVKVKRTTGPTRIGGEFTLGLVVEVVIGKDIAPEITINVAADLRTFSSRVSGADRISIKKKEPYAFPLLGLNVELRKDEDKAKEKEENDYEALALDLRGGRQSFGLGHDAKATVTYGAVATSGRGLVFDVPEFQVASDGLTLEAKVSPEPVTLGGVDVPFKFTSGGISIRQSKLLGGSLAGSGQLPRALIGEANANIALSLTAGEGGGIEVESAEARLDKAGDPIVCEGTRFRLDISELGMGFAKENAYHFYFLLTGSARFTPAKGEATEGLLKQLGKLEIQLKKAPLTSDARVLMRSISFQTKCEPPKTGNFFDIFKFELRGIGFHPSTQAFGGDPAISVSGQVKFAFGDVISSRIDCHQLYIAAPKAPSNFPRVRFDGLTVGLQIGMASIEGTAIAVDEKLPELFSPKTLPVNVTAKGFLAAGRIELKGWAPMSASMGFLELRDKVSNSAPKHAFYFYGQKNKLAEQIPTPIGTLYLREVGYGFGYRYTLAGIAQAEQAKSPKDLVKILDEVSKYQGSLDSIRAWEPTYGNDGLTLAMRALFTVSAASTSDSYNAEAEKELPNPLLFDVIAAIRSDLTFLMNVRSWVAVNYADWISAGENAAMKSNPTQRGYMYLSAPRQEFLGRFISDGKGHVGSHPSLPDPLKQAIERTRFSAALYLRPGLFHSELGWPYELGFDIGDRNGDFYVRCSGGLVHRIEDAGMLMAIAFRGTGHVRISGRVGGDSLGASASASATFALEAKALAYLSLRSKEGSMLYGSFQLNVTVAVAVAVWLRFKVWRYTVSLSAGFSFSLSLSVAVELVLLEGAGIGGRAHVAIGVQAFGRSLSLGIGFKFGSNVLDLARARVARFMDLGLTVDTPSAETPPSTEKRPGLEASRGDRATIADARTDKEAEQAPVLPSSPEATEGEDPRASGETITATNFWALVFPTRDPTRPDKKLYVVQLVPRDHTAVPGAEPDGEASTFYASPAVECVPGDELRPVDLAKEEFDHQLDFTTTVAGVERFDKDGRLVAVVASQHTEMLRERQVIAPQPGTSGITLGELLIELFMGPDSLNPGAMTEPTPRKNDGARDVLKGDAQAKAMRLERAGRARRQLTGRERQEAEVDERRSAVLSAVVETAASLAARGADAGGQWPAIPPGQLECRHFGLTFVMTQAAIDTVFPHKEALAPPEGKLSITKRDAPGQSGSVHLFNPPIRHFRERAPRLAGLVAERNSSGVTLNWDLEPAWGASQGAYDDPEFHLSHYTIVRRIHGLKGDKDWRATFRVKGAAPIETGKVGNQKYQKFIRPDMQFVDDFSQPPGMDEALRHMLMGLPVEDGYRLWEKQYCGSDNVHIEYLIVPVDIAGTSDVGTPIELTVYRPKAVLKTPLQARLQVRYNAIPVVGWSPADSTPIGVEVQGKTIDYADKGPTLRLSMAVDADRGDPGQPAETDATFCLKVRSNHVIPGGLFGDDALSAALDRPSSDDIEQTRPGDVQFRLLMEKGDADTGTLPLELQLLSGRLPDDVWRMKVQDHDGQAIELDALYEALGLTAGAAPRTVRAFVRRESFTEGDDRVHGAWRVMELGVEVRGVRKNEPLLAHRNAPAPIDATLDSFEALRAIEYKCLHRSDMHVESGRLHLVKPPADADVHELLSDGVALKTVVDVKRRAATRLSWRAQPHRLELADGNAPEALMRSLVGGFDLFAMDPDLLPGDFSVKDAALDPSRYMQPLGRVMMLPSSMRGLVPSGFGDLGRIETSYPSETCRIEAAAAMRESELRPRLAPWFSPAESTAIFPRPLLRKSLFAAPDEALIATLLSKGLPERIRVRMEGWPRLEAIPRPVVTCFTEGADVPEERVFLREEWKENELVGADVRYVDPDSRTCVRFTAARVRLLLQSLQLEYERGADKDWHGAVRANPALFAGVKVIVEAMREAVDKAPTLLVSETSDFNPLTHLHPVLADALEFVTYDEQFSKDSQPGAIYRRYEVVYDADPQTNATSFAAWQDETPPPRDPYGWGGLRLLGLASGFRLYDTEEGNYVLGRNLLKRVSNAFRRALLRYRAAGEGDLGAPFMDLMCRPWGNSKLFWFDGGHRDLDAQEQGDLFDNDVLATVQIALRPVPDAFAPNPNSLMRPVAYYRFWVDKLATELHFTLMTPATAAMRFYDLVEVGGFVQPKPTRVDDAAPSLVLKLQPAGKRREFIVRVASLPAAKGEWRNDVGITAVVGLAEEIAEPAGVTWPDAETAVAYYRFWVDASATELRFKMKTTGTAANRFYDVVEFREAGQMAPVRVDDTSPSLVLQLKPTAKRREFIVRVSSMTAAEGRWLHDVDIAAVAGVENGLQRPAAATANGTCGTDPFGLFEDLSSADWCRLLSARDGPTGYRLGATLDRLDFYAMRRFGPADLLKDSTEAEEHVRRNVAFWRAYLEHGDSAEASHRLPFSLGTVADPGTWRVPVSADGSMSIVAVEAERFGSRRRYAVRPFGRFEQLSATVPSASIEEAVGDKVERRIYKYKPPQGLERGLPQDVRAWNESFVDATLPRTEPVAKPVILAAGCLDRERALELVVAHTSDHVLAQANRGTQARVAQHGIGVGFWREFPHRAWARALAPDADVLAEFGSMDGEIPEEDLALSVTTPNPGGDAKNDALDQLRRRVPDAWMGSWVIRARSMPYFFRIHALVHATAGVMVSEQTGTTFAEGFSRLQLPWGEGHHQPRSVVPQYSVLRDDEARRLSIRFRFATVRFIDCMDEEDVKLWFGDPLDTVPRVARLPEPGVGYRIVLQAARSTGEVLAWQPQFEVLAAPPQEQAEQRDVYIVQQTGERLRVPGSGDKPTMTRPSADGDQWYLVFDAHIGYGAPSVRSPAADAWSDEARNAAASVVFSADDEALRKWVESAPRDHLHVTLTRPDATEWEAFEMKAAQLKIEVERWQAKLGVLDGAVELLDNLLRIAGSDGQQDALWDEYFEGKPNSPHVSIGDWMIGVPPLLAPLGTADTVEVGDSRERTALLHAMAHLASDEAKTLRAFLHGRMRRVHAARSRVERESPFDGVPPLSKPLAADSDLGAIIEGASAPLSHVVGVMYAPVSVTLPASPPGLDALENLLAILEVPIGAGDALAVVLAWADNPQAMNVSLALPLKVDDKLRYALQGVGATDIGESAAAPVAVVLWRPPTSAEIDAVSAASERLAKLAAEQLFGAGKRPALLVTRGAELPLETVFERKA